MCRRLFEPSALTDVRHEIPQKSRGILLPKIYFLQIYNKKQKKEVIKDFYARASI